MQQAKSAPALTIPVPIDVSVTTRACGGWTRVVHAECEIGIQRLRQNAPTSIVSTRKFSVLTPHAGGTSAAVHATVRLAHLGLLGIVWLVMAVAIGAQQAAQTANGLALTLDAAVAEALEKNLDLIATRAGVTIADANLITARLRPNPVLSLGGDHLDFLGTGFNEENGAGPPEYSVRVDFLLERGAKRGAAYGGCAGRACDG